MVWRIGIIGLGKITEDQHVPVVAKNRDFVLAAVTSQRGLTAGGAPTFRTPAEMYRAVPDLDAVAVCTPPQVRHTIAREALAAGKHVMLEKPPAATTSELADLAARAIADRERGVATLDVTLDVQVSAQLVAVAPDEDLVALDEALNALGAVDPRKSRTIELRFFGGLSIEEAARVLAVSSETVKRDSRLAKAWLLRWLTDRETR